MHAQCMLLLLSDVVRPSFEANEGARGVQYCYGCYNQSPSRAARPPEVLFVSRCDLRQNAQRAALRVAGQETSGKVLFSCSAAARSACVSTWLGEANDDRRNIINA